MSLGNLGELLIPVNSYRQHLTVKEMFLKCSRHHAMLAASRRRPAWRCILSTEEFYVVQPYGLSQLGRCYPLSPVEMESRAKCLRAAKALARRHGGARAIRHVVHYPFNQFDAAVVIGEFGALPDGGFTIA